MNDVELAARAERGDLAAFTTLYRRYHRLAFHTAYKVTRSREAAEDIAADVFLALAEGKWRLDPERTPGGEAGGFVKTLAYFRGLEHRYRRPLDNHTVENFDDAGSIYHRLTCRLPDPETQLLRAEVRRRIHETIDALPPQYQRVAVCRYFGELTCPEIAELIGVKAITIPSYLATIREKLRAALNGYATVRPKGSRQSRGGYIRHDDQRARYAERKRQEQV